MADRFVGPGDTTHVRLDAKRFDSFVYFGAREVDGDGPQMYINEVDPGVELAAHFHRVDQFQVFFGTSGSVFQRKPVPALFVHYTDAFSAYGPFRAGPDAPLPYATIRARSTNYGGVMPGARTERPYRGARQLSAEVEGWETKDMPSAGQVEHRAVFDEASDGLSATHVRLGAGTQLVFPAGLPTSGRAYCIAEGSLTVDGHRYGPRSLGWRGQAEHGSPVTAGTTGASVLVLNFPSPATPDAHAGDLATAKARS